MLVSLVKERQDSTNLHFEQDNNKFFIELFVSYLVHLFSINEIYLVSQIYLRSIFPLSATHY